MPLVLLEIDAPLLTRELITQQSPEPKERFEIITARRCLLAVARCLQRPSGPKDALWGGCKQPTLGFTFAVYNGSGTCYTLADGGWRSIEMNYLIIPVTPFEQNCSLIWCDETGGCGGRSWWRSGRDIGGSGQPQVDPEKILITHAHIDHAGGAGRLARETGVPIEVHIWDDLFWIKGMPEQSRMFNFPGAEVFEPSCWLEQAIGSASATRRLRSTTAPDTPGHVIFSSGHWLAIVGDVCSKALSAVPTFPEGTHATLLNSIRQRLWLLGDDVKFVAGHGPMSTIGSERRHNPF